MKPLQADLLLSRAWLLAVENASRDSMGVLSRPFLKNLYRHAAREFLRLQTTENGFAVAPVKTAQQAIEEYVQAGATGGLLRSEEDIEIKSGGEHRLELTVHRCPYKSVCQTLVDAGLRTNELTCPRLGCLSGAIELLAKQNANYELEEFVPHGLCRGTLETLS